MYQELLKKFSDQNPERFNEDFIRSKGSDDIVKEVTSIFKQLEVIKEIHVDDVSLDTHEENFGPIKQQGSFYKSLMPSRLIKIHYKVHIDGLAHPISKDMYLPKMLDDCFYINEGVRFYPIWQIVDNLSYATNNGVSLKSLMMPITIIANDKIVANTENGKGVVTVPDFCALIFSKKVSPLFYYMCKLSLDSLDAAGISVYDDIDSEFVAIDKCLA